MIDILQRAPTTSVTVQNWSNVNVEESGISEQSQNNKPIANNDFMTFNHTNEKGSHSHNEKIDKDKLIKELNNISKSLEVDIKFAYNDKINEMYVRIIDKVNGKVIRQIPTQEAMKIKESMKDFIGSLFDMKG